MSFQERKMSTDVIRALLRGAIQAQKIRAQKVAEDRSKLTCKLLICGESLTDEEC
jgi:hypothetical protein